MKTEKDSRQARKFNVGLMATTLSMIPALAVGIFALSPTDVSAASNSDFCVTAQHADDPEIVSKRGPCSDEVIAPEPETVETPVAEESTPAPSPSPAPTTPPPPADSFAEGSTPIAHANYQTEFQNATTTATTSTRKQFIFTISGLTNNSDYEVTWEGSGLDITNSKFTPISATNGYFYINVDPLDSKGFATGDSYYTATVKNKATGSTSVKSWKLTVTDPVIQAQVSHQALFLDRSVQSMTTTKTQFVFEIQNASPSDYTVEYTSTGDSLNSDLIPRSNSTPTYWYVDVTPKSGGYTVGQSVITAKATHTGTGKVLTKSWTMTVTPGDVMAHANYGNEFKDRTTSAGSTSRIQYLFTMPGNFADYSVAWSNSNAAGLNSTVTPIAESGPKYWYVNVDPGAGGFAQGSSTITATVTHIPTGDVYTKTWNLTVN